MFRLADWCGSNAMASDASGTASAYLLNGGREVRLPSHPDPGFWERLTTQLQSGGIVTASAKRDVKKPVSRHCHGIILL